MNGDEFYGGDDGGEEFMRHADMNKMSSKMSNDGYRIGKGKEDEKQAQRGFDAGFGDGMTTGRACGRLYGALRCSLKAQECTSDRSLEAIDSLLSRAEVIFFEDIPERRKPMDQILEEILGLINSIDDVRLSAAYNEFVGSIAAARD